MGVTKEVDEEFCLRLGFSFKCFSDFIAERC